MILLCAKLVFLMFGICLTYADHIKVCVHKTVYEMYIIIFVLFQYYLKKKKKSFVRK